MDEVIRRLMELHADLPKTTDETIFAGIVRRIEQLKDETLDPFFANAYRAPPMVELYYRRKLTHYSNQQQSSNLIREVHAFRTNVTDKLHEQIATRRKWGGNVVLEWTGPTGTGKSSCMLGLMERHNELRDIVLAEGTNGLRKHIALDVAELPAKLERLRRGHAVAMDEQFHLIGEGARNKMDTLANLEETLRGTGIDIHFASPSLREHTTSQGILEAVSWDRDKHRTVFLYKLALAGNPVPEPLGYVVLPWCSKEVFEAYEPIKAENLERTKRLQFNAASATLDEEIRRFFEFPQIQARFKVKTPNRDDLARWWKRTMSATGMNESYTYAEEILEMIRVMRHAKDQFVPIYGWEPTEAMLECVKGSSSGAGQRAF